MAIYHLTAKTGSKAKGGSAGRKADYIEREEKYAWDFEQVIHHESGNMPTWAMTDDRDDNYWNNADRHERENGRLYKELEFALPKELTVSQQIKLVNDFVEDIVEKEKLPYTYAIHKGDERTPNPHCHLMISERKNDGLDRTPETWFKRYNAKNLEKGGAQKTTSLKPKEWLLDTRELWSVKANEALKNAGHDIRIDHRTLKDQGINREPTIHIGANVSAMDRKGISTNRMERFEEIKSKNDDDLITVNPEIKPIIDTKNKREKELKKKLIEIHRNKNLSKQEKQAQESLAYMAKVLKDKSSDAEITGKFIGIREISMDDHGNRITPIYMIEMQVGKELFTMKGNDLNRLQQENKNLELGDEITLSYKTHVLKSSSGFDVKTQSFDVRLHKKAEEVSASGVVLEYGQSHAEGRKPIPYIKIKTDSNKIEMIAGQNLKSLQDENGFMVGDRVTIAYKLLPKIYRSYDDKQPDVVYNQRDFQVHEHQRSTRNVELELVSQNPVVSNTQLKSPSTIYPDCAVYEKIIRGQSVPFMRVFDTKIQLLQTQTGITDNDLKKAAEVALEKFGREKVILTSRFNRDNYTNRFSRVIKDEGISVNNFDVFKVVKHKKHDMETKSVKPMKMKM
jgi:hypothetical protein